VRDLLIVGGLIVVAAERSEVELYRSSGGGAPRLLVGHKGWVRALAASADGTMLVSGGHDGKAIVWSLPDGRKLRTIEAHPLWVSALAVSPDGRHLATAGFDRTIRLWDLRSGERLRQYDGHSRVVVDLAFGPAGGQLASASLDRTARIWNVLTGQLEGILDEHRYQVSALAYARGGRLLVTVSGDGYLRLWPQPALTSDAMRILAPPGPGEVTLRNNTSGERQRLRLVDKRGRVAPGATKALARVMRSGPDDRQSLPDAKLIKLLFRVADHFGREREVTMISGYRSPQYNALRTRQSRQVARKSRHMSAQAIDIRIEGVPITDLRDYVKSLRAGGVGFYADSQFVHMDTGPVRYW